jgi:mercuric ion transport protein
MAIQSEPTAKTAGENVASRPADRMTAIAGVLGAIAASSCCVLPLLFVSLGVSGAWIGNLTALAPYQPYILALTVAVLGLRLLLRLLATATGLF